MSELEKLLENKKTNTQKTLSNYIGEYDLLKKYLDKNIIDSEEDEILEKAKQASKTLTTLNRLIFLSIMIRRLYSKSIEILTEEQQNITLQIKKETEEKLKNINLPDYDEVKNYIDNLTDKRKYIVNYLMFYYGLRNEDIHSFITDTKGEDNKNYLIVKEKECEFIINKYKTYKTYGKKIIIIQDKKFMEMLKLFPLNVWLLTGTDNSKISIGSCIKNLTYLKLGEINYFKINISNIQKNDNKNILQELEKISKFRGTSIDVIVSNYDINKL